MEKELRESLEAYMDDPDSQVIRQDLVNCVQMKENARDVIAGAVDGDFLANVFNRASFMSHTNVLQALLDKGMNIDVKDESGFTALIAACDNRQKESVRFLLNHDANVDAQDNDGYTAILYASKHGDSGTVELLLERNANVDLVGVDGWTALMFACFNDHVAVVAILLAHHANVEAKNEEGQTALDLCESEEAKKLFEDHASGSCFVLK